MGGRLAVAVVVAGYLVAVLPGLMEASSYSEAWELLRPVAWLSLGLAYLAGRARCVNWVRVCSHSLVFVSSYPPSLSSTSLSSTSTHTYSLWSH